MDDYLVPCEAAEREFTEKRSRFIGQVWRVEDESEARRRIEETRRRYHDARHNCWCYVIHDGGLVRYSDDGEPQGTAGQPMLNVFQRRGVENVCCVVTRYFGGILLGAGGLARAYGKAAKDALDAAGVSRMQRWTLWEIPCPYSLLEQMKLALDACHGRIEETEYGAEVLLQAAFPGGEAEKFAERCRQISAGSVHITAKGEAYRPGEALKEEISL